MNSARIGRRQLEKIQGNLTERDLEILRSVAAHHFLTTSQICRLCFAETTSPTAALRSANRALARLCEQRTLFPLDRRIGGVRAGSGSYVWGVGTAGARILERMNASEEDPRRFREYEPSTVFLEHTLAVAEVSVRLQEAARRGELAIIGIEYEPASWRAYVGSGGGTLRVKPDLALVTATKEFEDHWFLEIDLATEPPSRIIRTCLSYEAYRRSGEEQRRRGIFPAVVWIVPSLKRKEVIESRLGTTGGIDAGLFTVVTLDELEPLLRRGATTAPEAEAGVRR